MRFSGWTWASLDSIGDMFRSLTGYPEIDPGWVVHGRSAWAPVVFELFEPTYIERGILVVDGISRDQPNEFSAYRALVVDRPDGGTDWISTHTALALDFSHSSIGAWLHRPVASSAVPEPAPSSLLLLGAVVLLVARRYRFSARPA